MNAYKLPFRMHTVGTACPTWGVSSLPWSDAMGAVFISGWVYIFLTFTGLRSMLFVAIPKSLQSAITVGIGFFITIIGLKIGQLTRVTLQPWAIGDVFAAGQCADTPDGIFCNDAVNINFAAYDLGIVKFNNHPEGDNARIAVIGLVIVSALECLKMRGALIISIMIATFIGINYSKYSNIIHDTVIISFEWVMYSFSVHSALHVSGRK